MDVQYLFMQILLLMIIFVGIRYVSCMKEANLCRFLRMNLSKDGVVLSGRFTCHIGKEKIHAYDKYEMWRYAEHKRDLHLCEDVINIKENEINGEFSKYFWRSNKVFIRNDR